MGNGLSTRSRVKTSLRTKIMGGYVAITLLALAVGLWSSYNYLRFSGELNTMMVQNYRSVVAASNMVAAIERQDSAALLMLLGDREAEVLFDRSQADFLAWFARAEDNITLPGEGEVVDEIRARYEEYGRALRGVQQAAAAGLITAEAVSQAYRDSVLPRFDAARHACQELLRINDEAMRTVQSRMTVVTARAVWSTLAAGAIALVTAVSLGFTISELIARPVRRLAESARRVGEGHLDEAMVVTGTDEVGVLAREFNSMVERLRETRASNTARLVASQRKLASVIDSIADGLVVTDTEYRIESVNPVARQVFGWREGEAVGRFFPEVVGDTRLAQLLERAGEGPVPVQRLVEDKKKFYLAQAMPVYHQGRLLGMVLWLRDVTAYEEAERSKADFMSAISHELRTPLASLTMGIGLLAESKVIRAEEREGELVRMLQEDSRRLGRLVDELFELSRLQTGQVPMSFSRVEVAELVEKAILPFTAQAEGQGVKLRHEVTAGIPAVRADQEKIVWVISNLIANALRYTPAGGSITIAAEREGRRVYISVRDTGSGIPKDKQEAIFRPYVQLEGPKGAAGLGLSICRDIVRAHGGRIWVESEPGRGSKFTFSLLVEEPPSAEATDGGGKAGGTEDPGGGR